jgi:hypothetical protein
MSLAMFAAPINDNSNITFPNNMDNSDNILNQKRHKRTQRKYPKIENFDTNKVNSVLQKIHDNLDEDDEYNEKDSFNPPPNPQSAGVQKTIPKTESFVHLGSSSQFIGKNPSPNYEGGDDLDLNDYNNYGDSKSNEKYYNSVLPGYKNTINRPYYNSSYTKENNNENSQDILLQKLNYMISLLEDQKDEKTNNVTEEVILYSFLGIFIIFIADTFVRAGKYVR